MCSNIGARNLESLQSLRLFHPGGLEEDELKAGKLLKTLAHRAGSFGLLSFQTNIEIEDLKSRYGYKLPNNPLSTMFRYGQEAKKVCSALTNILELSNKQHNLCKDSLLHLERGGCKFYYGKNCDGKLINKLKTMDKMMDITFTELIQAEAEEAHLRLDIQTIIEQRSEKVRNSRKEAILAETHLEDISNKDMLRFNF